MAAVVRLLTYRQVAARYQVTERTVRNWAAKGAVQIVLTPGGRPRVVDDAEEPGNSDEHPIEQEPPSA